MHYSAFISLAFAAIANAHFQLQYPSPRGPFVEDSEPSFCDGYTDATTRMSFPLSNGVIEFNSEHTDWTAAVIVSAKQDPTSFTDFNSSSGYQYAVPFFKQTGEGLFCFPINLAASGVSGVQDGANVTIQVIFDGGDGELYQCADLTLSANASVPSNATSSCTNITPTQSSSGTAAAPTKTGGSKKEGVQMFGVGVAAVMSLASLLI